MNHQKPLSNQQWLVIEQLARFQYLTVSQMVRLGITNSPGYLRGELLPGLCQKRPKLVNKARFAPLPSIGSLEHVYWLTKAGATELATYSQQDLEETIFPRYGLRYTQDYFHRKATVDFTIGFYQWCQRHQDISDSLFQYYFQFLKGRNNHSVNKVYFRPTQKLPTGHPRSVVPDVIMSFSKGSRRVLCIGEIHLTNDPKAIVNQLDRHMTALDQGIYHEAFPGHNEIHILSVYNSVKTFKAVIKRLLDVDDFEHFSEIYHFNILKNVKSEFQGWIRKNGTKSKIFMR